MTTVNIKQILQRTWIWLASLYMGLLVFWFLIFIVVFFSRSGLSILSELLWVGAVLYGVLFILLPVIYWRVYAALAWVINVIFLLLLTLSMVKLGYIIASDPLYLENNERIWGPGFQFMHFVLFGVTSLFIYTLRRPALFHARALWRALRGHEPL